MTPDQGSFRTFPMLLRIWGIEENLDFVLVSSQGPARSDVNFHPLFIEVPSMVNFEAMLINFLFKQQTKQPMGWFVIMKFFTNIASCNLKIYHTGNLNK